MKNIAKKISILIILLSVFSISRADEGMWLINLLDKNLSQKMKQRGLKIDSKVIYDENSTSLSDAIVSLDFGCTGSMISNDGLLITNHHCAYGDIHSLSTPEHNYLEDGYWAMSRDKELPIKGKRVFFLRKAMDVTQEIHSIIDSLRKGKNRGWGMRKVYSIIETKHQKSSGYEVMCMSMWKGSKYYMYYYEVYSDIRLVGAPPVSIAAFGGETDNWEWPQHKGDFALYRVYGAKDGSPAAYSKENVPIAPKRVLKISTKGVKEGDYTMIMGYPGTTSRYSSSFAVNYKETLANPITVEIKRKRLDIMKKWMESDPAIRLKYSDEYFGISNVQELREGEMNNIRRFNVVNIRRNEEAELAEWIKSSPEATKKWGGLLEEMEKTYKKLENNNRALQYFRETMVSGSGFIYIGNRVNSLRASLSRAKCDTLCKNSAILKSFIKSVEGGHALCDMRVEKELMNYQLKLFLDNVPELYWGEYIQSLVKEMGKDSQKITNYIFENSILLNPAKFKEAVSKDQPAALYTQDPCALFCKSTGMEPFNKEESRLVGRRDMFTLESQYTRALYSMREAKGRVQYPDANSTMRLTYGAVGTLSPSDAINYSAQSTIQGYLDKFNPNNYEFNIKPAMAQLIENKDWGGYDQKGTMYVNFLTDNDITGGNSGSPVMNSKGELIGLAFDGNKESLAGDVYFHPKMNKTVCVDIRFVLWVIDKYAGAGNIIEEIKQSNNK